ncbi:30S ribosomal protein S2 [Enterobacteriaceae endosymbiont of Neohaemonia nigricornis]|uniref:30S ribosomal protein S2 n=1 Tax=Enterobacteriaceae endosymbiont of Neohaemonia nigricornis TaxID=2675792 RepID=UPI001448C0DA|nr:30S ribosomal protein S2 [Enterobacteriaceae endosymbiont of Neohaemonia nigricornis]QJC30426.1 30S ribosomal protein S2 [Enterobacteriaceae endosymbiont of Neohaemonia nigricornis]
MMSISIQKMFNMGVHFGHQTRFWNPKMKKYIFNSKNKIHIINLDKTLIHFNKAILELKKISRRKGKILFVGTKKSASKLIKKTAQDCNQFFINYRWLGGMLTNWKTVKKSIKKLKELEIQSKDGTFKQLTKKESLTRNKILLKLQKNLDGIKNMVGLPDAIFVVDAYHEKIAIQEAKKLNIPIFAIVDTNSNPDGINYVIPGNDDAIRAIKLYLYYISKALLDKPSLELQKQNTDFIEQKI